MTKMMQLQEKMKKNVNLRNRLALMNYKTGYTIERWIRTNSIYLRTEMNVEVIAEELGLTVEEVRAMLNGNGQVNGNPPA
jgi:DNA-directed RNA polymerase specialized sigma subunit